MSNEAGTVRIPFATTGSFPEGTTVSIDEARRCERWVFAEGFLSARHRPGRPGTQYS